MNYNYPWKAKLPQLRIYKNVFMKFDYIKMSKHRVSIVMIKLLRHDAHHHKVLTLQRYLCLSYQPPDMLPIFFQVWVIYLPLIIFVTSWSIIPNVIYWFGIESADKTLAKKFILICINLYIYGNWKMYWIKSHLAWIIWQEGYSCDIFVCKILKICAWNWYCIQKSL